MQKRSNILYAAILFFLVLTGCNDNVHKQTSYTKNTPNDSMLLNQKIWTFILAGQSNMAGRGEIEPQDTVTSARILSINKKGDIIKAKEPLHFYEPDKNGLDCGLSFGQTLTEHLPDSISVLLIPTAVGGTRIEQWIEDKEQFGVKLLSNFKEKTAIGKRYGVIKGILWHQGESDANDYDIPRYKDNLKTLMSKFRNIVGNDSLPIIIGELGSYSRNNERWQAINTIIHDYADADSNTVTISTSDLEDKGDKLHFNSESIRILGDRYANAFLKHFSAL